MGLSFNDRVDGCGRSAMRPHLQKTRSPTVLITDTLVPFSLSFTVAETTLPILLTLITPSGGSSSPQTLKLALLALTSTYPLLFRHLSLQRSPTPTSALLWKDLKEVKRIVKRMASGPSGEEGTSGEEGMAMDMDIDGSGSGRMDVPAGVRVAAWKFLGKCVVIGTRGSADPRVSVLSLPYNQS